MYLLAYWHVNRVNQLMNFLLQVDQQLQVNVHGTATKTDE